MNKLFRIQFFLVCFLLLGSTVHACYQQCQTICDRHVTDNWYRFNANDNYVENGGGVKGCKVNYGVERQECWTVCPAPSSMNKEGNDFFFSDVYAAPPASQCEGTALVECDGAPPTGTAKYIYEDEVAKVVVESCNDNLSGCDPSSYTSLILNPNNPNATVRICDFAGNCADIAPPEDIVPPQVDITIDWAERLLEYDIVCKDALTFCNVGGRDNFSYDPATQEFRFTIPYDVLNKKPEFNICDFAGNCQDYPAPFDLDPPTGSVDFDGSSIWHNLSDFPELQCKLVSCSDAISGCVAVYEDGRKYPNGFSYSDPGGAITPLPIVVDDLDPVHGDKCSINVCDNAGNCSVFTSPALKYDNTYICAAGIGLSKSSDGVCGECDADDDDCLCIKGDVSKCRDDGPVNCYTNPFHDRCPGFQNPACLIDPFTPGCPVLNPCYPTQVYDGVICPRDAIRFCARNPYHYGCNVACESGTIDCNPVPPGVNP